ncbi:uncharacterized protein LOC107265297 isoform X2 [Cephus cinctus]|nr:uncharacterized protein LOC107265297 isoform X2 [Cephus cinctus]XP_015590093.1 uncharacterized protein LOC107265297 isoform X2 [Cephus cinctus]XP_024938250.1 uncharacterized protein LOC107265297 isoform X2 [Cephus cinctus]
MNKRNRKSPEKHVQSKSKVDYKETDAYKKARKNRSDDDETFDSESNSSNNRSSNSSNSELKSRIKINQKNSTADQGAKKRKNGSPAESFENHKSEWKKYINHTVVRWCVKLTISIFILMCVFGGWYIIVFNNPFSEKSITQFEEDIDHIKKKFPMQMPDIWNDFSAGVKTIIEETSKRPAVFVLLANNTNTLDCLSTSIGNVISRSLGGKECLILGPKNFISSSGDMLEWLRPKIEQKKVVVVNDILKISSDAIGSFHWLCDDTNPLVSRAVYLITMTINVLHMHHDNLTKLVEEHIYNTFSKAIHFDILHAAVSRITSGAILSIISEPNLIEGAECP